MNTKNYLKNINLMTDTELENRYNINKKRIIGNNVFLGTITIGGLFIFSPSAIATLGVSAFRTYYINKNNQKLESEVRKRS